MDSNFFRTTKTFVCEQLNSFVFSFELPIKLQLMFLNFNFVFFTYTRVTRVMWKTPFAIGALQMTQTTSVGKNIHKNSYGRFVIVNLFLNLDPQGFSDGLFKNSFVSRRK